MRRAKKRECTKCGQSKGENDFYGPKRCYCKECERKDARYRMHREDNRIKNAHRNACKMAAYHDVESDLTQDDVLYLFKLAGGRCAYCERFDVLTLEHIQPMSKGGKNTLSNCTVVCAGCNAQKKDGDLLNFLEERLRAKQADEIIQQVAARRGQDFQSVLAEFIDDCARNNNIRIRRIMASWKTEQEVVN